MKEVLWEHMNLANSICSWSSPWSSKLAHPNNGLTAHIASFYCFGGKQCVPKTRCRTRSADSFDIQATEASTKSVSMSIAAQGFIGTADVKPSSRAW